MKFTDALKIYTDSTNTKDIQVGSMKLLSMLWSMLAIAQCKLDDVFIVTDYAKNGKSVPVRDYINETRGILTPEILAHFEKVGFKLDEINDPNAVVEVEEVEEEPEIEGENGVDGRDPEDPEEAEDVETVETEVEEDPVDLDEDDEIVDVEEETEDEKTEDE